MKVDNNVNNYVHILAYKGLKPVTVTNGNRTKSNMRYTSKTSNDKIQNRLVIQNNLSCNLLIILLTTKFRLINYVNTFILRQ